MVNIKSIIFIRVDQILTKAHENCINSFGSLNGKINSNRMHKLISKLKKI